MGSSPGVPIRPYTKVLEAGRIGRPELLFVGQGAEVVRGQELDHLLRPIGQLTFRPLRDIEMLGGPIAFRQRVVRDVPDQDMAEAVLRGASQCGWLAGHHQFLDP